jgi:alkylation response protein AidB-like acyl-CoA dehydrogenase
MKTDLNTCDLRTFRTEIERFVSVNLPPSLQQASRLATSVFCDFRAMMEWQKLLHYNGMAAPAWPSEFGGCGWDPERILIFREVCASFDAPQLTSMGIQMLGPILISYGTNAQKSELLPRILSGEDFWCQGYSEPSAGSDLGALSTKAERQGDFYVVNGSKIWTSLAQHSNKIFCLVRSAKEKRPNNSISFLLIDLDTPGVEVRPIVSLDGAVEQCEVFFTDVKVPVENIVGDENDGWKVALSLLEHERGGASYYVGLRRKLELIKEYSESSLVSRIVSERCKDELLDIEADVLSLTYLERGIAKSTEGDSRIGALSSLTKLIGTELGQRLDEVSLSLRGRDALVVMEHELDPYYAGEKSACDKDAAAFNSYINNRASTIYGGTAQIQRNIIAKKILML